MAESMKDRVKDVGNSIAETATKVVDKIAGGGDCCHGERNCAIQEHMDVIASCGKKVGVVDHVQGTSIKLTKNDSADGRHHLIPEGWVDHVDTHVHLKKNSVETEREWQTI